MKIEKKLNKLFEITSKRELENLQEKLDLNSSSIAWSEHIATVPCTNHLSQYSLLHKGYLIDKYKERDQLISDIDKIKELCNH